MVLLELSSIESISGRRIETSNIVLNTLLIFFYPIYFTVIYQQMTSAFLFL